MRTHHPNTKSLLDQDKSRQVDLLNNIQKDHLTGAWEWDPETDHYFWTDSLFFLHGLLPSSDNLISVEAASHMIHPQDLPLFQKLWEGLKKSGAADYFFRVILPEGKIKQLHARGKAFRDQEGKLIFRGTYQEETGEIAVSLTDEIVKLEIQLNILERAEQVAQMGSWQINLSTFDTFYSENIFRLYGVPPGTLNTHLDTFVKFIHPEDRNVVISAFEKAYFEKIPVHLEYRIIRQDEDVRFIKQLSSIVKNEKGEHLLTGTTHDITEKKLLELTLQELYDEMKLQHELFQQAEQLGGIGNWQINLHTRKTWYSDNAYIIHGIKPQSIQATPETFLSYIHPEDRPAIIEVVSKIYDAQILPSGEYRIIRPDGRTRILKQITKRITNPAGEELITGVIQDITEQHTTRSELNGINEQIVLQNESFAQAEKIVAIGSLFWNLSNNHVNFSDYLYNILGVRPGSAIPAMTLLARLVHPEDKSIFEDVIDRLKREESNVDTEYRIVRADGDTRFLRNRNKLIISPAGDKIVISTIQDITHEVLLSQELSARIDFTEMLSDTILDVLIVTDTTNNIIACNKQCEKTHLFKKQEVFRKNIFDIFPSLKNAEMVENFRKALQGKTIHIPAVRTALAKGYHNLLMRPLKNKKEEIIGVLTLLHDVTQEHQLQQQLKERLTFIEKLVESSIDRIMVLDSHLNYILWNKNCEKFYGIKKEDILGKNVLELFPMFKVDPIYQDCKRALNGENIHIPPRKTNDDEYNESFLVPLRNENAEVTGILWIIHDLSEIMQAKEKLVTSEAHLKTAQEIAHLGSWEYDHATGSLIWSDEVYRLYGYEPGSFEPTVEFYKNTSHPDHRDKIDDLLAVPARSSSFVNKIYTLDGRIRYVQTMGHPVIDESGNATRIIGTVQDITEQKILQDQLHQKTAAIRSQYENSRQAEMMRNVSTWQWSPQTGKVFWSENMFRILGYKPHSFDPSFEKFVALIHPEDKQVFLNAVEGIGTMETGILPEFEYRIIRPNGKILYARTTCRITKNQDVVSVTGTMQDVTTEVLQKQQLSSYHHLLETVVESCSDAIGVFDHQWFCTSWNNGSEQLFKITKTEALGRHLLDIFPEINNDADRLKIEQVIKGRDEVHLEEASIGIKGFTATCKPLVHGKDENTGFLLITRDS